MIVLSIKSWKIKVIFFKVKLNIFSAFLMWIFSRTFNFIIVFSFFILFYIKIIKIFILNKIAAEKKIENNSLSKFDWTTHYEKRYYKIKYMLFYHFIRYYIINFNDQKQS